MSVWDRMLRMHELRERGLRLVWQLSDEANLPNELERGYFFILIASTRRCRPLIASSSGRPSRRRSLPVGGTDSRDPLHRTTRWSPRSP